MANVVAVSRLSRQKYAVVGLGHRAGKVSTVKAAVSDGDTVSSHPYDNLGVRFLGVDAPEKGLPIGKTSIAFYALWKDPKEIDEKVRRAKNLKKAEAKAREEKANAKRWTRFLATGALQQYTVGRNPGDMEPDLHDYLKARLKTAPEGAARNHRYHALRADEALSAEIQKDIRDSREQPADFRFFLAFAHDVMDGFGRLLCYINRNEPDKEKRQAAAKRKNKPDQYYFYQERLLRAGLVSPLFIWPNVDPFIDKANTSTALVAAVVTPADIATLARRASRLQEARVFVRNARLNRLGIFNTANPDASPLALEAFELRYLGRGSIPRRYVIDLSATKPGDLHYGELIEPQKYFLIRNTEDRLYIPEEFAPLFLLHGWQMRAGAVPPLAPTATAPAAGEVVG